MQSFASSLPPPLTPTHQSPHPTKITHYKSNTTNFAPPTQKGRNYRLSSRKIFVESVESV